MSSQTALTVLAVFSSVQKPCSRYFRPSLLLSASSSHHHPPRPFAPLPAAGPGVPEAELDGTARTWLALFTWLILLPKDVTGKWRGRCSWCHEFGATKTAFVSEDGAKIADGGAMTQHVASAEHKKAHQAHTAKVLNRDIAGHMHAAGQAAAQSTLTLVTMCMVVMLYVVRVDGGRAQVCK
jgi:hypothetical protein